MLQISNLNYRTAVTLGVCDVVYALNMFFITHNIERGHMLWVCGFRRAWGAARLGVSRCTRYMHTHSILSLDDIWIFIIKAELRKKFMFF